MALMQRELPRATFAALVAFTLLVAGVGIIAIIAVLGDRVHGPKPYTSYGLTVVAHLDDCRVYNFQGPRGSDYFVVCKAGVPERLK